MERGGSPNTRPVGALVAAIVAVLVAVGPPPAHAAGPTTYAAIESDPGEFITGGNRRWTFLPPDEAIVAQAAGSSLLLSAIDPATSTSFSARFTTPGALAPGTYTGASRGGTPGLEVNKGSIGCNTVAGSFTIHEIALAGDGSVAAADVEFERHCDGQAPALRGRIAYHATTELVTPSVYLEEVTSAPVMGGVAINAVVGNAGNTTSDPIAFTQRLPIGAIVSSVRASRGTCDATVACAIPPLAAGETAVVTMRLEAPAVFTTTGAITHGRDLFRTDDTLTFDTGISPPVATTQLALAYVTTEREGYAQIHGAGRTGTPQASISAGPYEDSGPRWSPDGTKIAFDRFIDGSDEIFVMNADGSGATRLTNDPATDEYPSWSPDGRKLVFDSDRAGNFDIYTMNVDGTGVRPLTTDPGRDDTASWSPDGTRIAFDSNRSGNWDIWMMSATGAGQVNLTADSPTDDLSRPDWSPDGTKLLFTSHRSGNADVWMMSPDGSNVRQLTTSPWVDGNATWAPDGLHFAYDSTRYEPSESVYPTPFFSLFVATADVGDSVEPVQITFEPTTTASWRPTDTAPFDPLGPATPLVAGAATVGSRLYAYWTAAATAPSIASIAWLRCDAAGEGCTPTGASGVDYTVIPADAGHTLRVAVTGTAQRVTATRISAPVGPVPGTPPAPVPPPPRPTLPAGGGGGGGGGGSRPSLKVLLALDRTTGVQVGDSLLLTATISNDPAWGGSEHTALLVTLPDGVTLTGIVPADRGPGCTGTTVVECNLDFLPPGMSAVVRIAVRVTTAPPLTFSVRATQQQEDVDPRDDSASVTIAAPATPSGAPAAPPAVLPATPRAATSAGVVVTGLKATAPKAGGHLVLTLKASGPASVQIRMRRANGTAVAAWTRRVPGGRSSLRLPQPHGWTRRAGDRLHVRVTAGGRTVERMIVLS